MKKEPSVGNYKDHMENEVMVGELLFQSDYIEKVKNT